MWRWLGPPPARSTPGWSPAAAANQRPVLRSAAPPMRGEYHLAAVRAGGGHQADQQRVEEGGDTLRGQGAPEREGPATTNQVSVFRAYQPIRAEYSEGASD